MIVELPQQIAYERRLPATNFAGDYGKAGAVHHAEFEHRERQSVILAPVDQIRIRQDRKRLFSKSIKRLIHRTTLENA